MENSQTAELAEQREGADRRQEDTPVGTDRRKVQRRHQIDPTTCERDYNNDEIEFMKALDCYKRASGRMFPTCSEILEVIRGLGYRKCDLDLEESEKSHEAVQQAVSDSQSNVQEDEDVTLFDEMDEED